MLQRERRGEEWGMSTVIHPVLPPLASIIGVRMFKDMAWTALLHSSQWTIGTLGQGSQGV